MVSTKREPAGGAKVKAEKDPDLARALKLSLQSLTVKAEKVKSEQRVGVKAEVRVGVKAEPVKVKAERGTSASSSSAQQMPTLSAKVEQLRQLGVGKIKAELLRKEEPPTGGVKDLVARAMAMRAKEQKGNVKKEKGARGKIKLVKVKKERARRLDGKLRRKPRITAKRRNASREVMAREVALSEELGEVLGAEALSRPEAVRRLWAYCRENNMLNPENRREIKFDVKLEKMMGQKTASMPELISLMMPHFDYTQTVVKSEMKSEPGRAAKLEPKREAKKEQGMAAKLEPKKEQQASAKREPKQEKTGSPSKRMKNEPLPEIPHDTAKALEALRATVPQICSFDRNTAVVGCIAPPGRFQLEVVAKPASSASGTRAEVRAPCAVEFREDKNGALEPHAEARLTGLNPDTAYHIKVQVCSGDGASHEALLPQRTCPKKWSPRDVVTWCQAQHVPELVKMTQEYAIDGTTLLSLGEQDLKASGLAAPFLLKRTLAALAALRTGGA